MIQKSFPLPLYERNQFFQTSDNFGFNLTIEPIFSEKGNNFMMEKYNEQYKKFAGELEGTKAEIDEQLVDLVNTIAQKKQKNVF